MTTAIPEYLEKKITWPKNVLILRIIIFYSTIVVLLFALQIVIGDLLFEYTDNITIINNILRGLTGIIGMIMCFIFLKYDNLRLKVIGLKNLPRSHILFLIAGLITLIALIPTVIIEIVLDIIPAGKLVLLNDIVLIVLTITFSFVGIGLGEEIIFRGYIQTVLESKFSFLQATIVSAFLFGLLHFIIGVFENNFIYMITWGIAGFIFGIGMSYIYRITGYSLVIPIAIHGFWDAYLFVFQADFQYLNWVMATGEIVAQCVGVVIFCILTYLIVRKFWPEIKSET